ncbi:MAG: methionyl-tRNA formyltransferase [Desulfobacteraceae bacterium]|nr:methionyl-tRNA formyltransferase [Desulfobacteraceae bacterium]
MGTPDFSVPALKAILNSEHNISLVVTQPDRPKGRGRKVTPSPVKQVAKKFGIEVIQPENINNPLITKQLKALNPDLFVVVAFGQKLSKEILNIPTIYPVNIHASLLPQYRGSSPIQAAITNLDKTTGVTTMIMGESLDTGDILLTSTTDILTNDTAESLHDRLADMGGDLICSTLDAISASSLNPVPQNHKLATFAPMLKKSDGEIHWEESSEKICAKIRAMTPWPGAFTNFNKKTLKIFRAEPIKSNESGTQPGTILEYPNNEIHVASGNGAVNILELMGKSGKRLKADQFLRGNKLEKGMKFTNNDS